MKSSILDNQKLEEFRQENKLQPFRIKQIYHNIFKNSIIDFDEMTDLSKDLRKKLKEKFYIVSLEPVKIQETEDTTKIAFKNKDGHIFETVLMYHRKAGYKQDNRIKYIGKYSDITEKIIGTAYKVYNTLGSGLQEKVYQKAMEKLLRKEGLNVEIEVKKGIFIDEEQIGYGKIDILVNSTIVIELKVSDFVKSGDYHQIKKYLSAKYPVGLIITFGKNGVNVKRVEFNYQKTKTSASNPEILSKSGNPDLNRITICLSSQIGCAVGCKFCVTGKLGFISNLTDKEILEQILRANNYVKNKFGKKEDKTWHKIRNVVFMGMGEPMLNYENVKKSILMMLDQKKLSLSKRHITISTSGIVPGIKQMISDNLDVMLAISLHSANPTTRAEIMPITQRYSLDELMEVLDEYVEKTNNRVFYEYIMIKDLTDTIEQAKYLVNLLKGKLAHVNLIPYNENPVVDYKTPSLERILKFKKYLENNGITATIRTTMGEEIKGACGQLGYEKVKNK